MYIDCLNLELTYLQLKFSRHIHLIYSCNNFTTYIISNLNAEETNKNIFTYANG